MDLAAVQEISQTVRQELDIDSRLDDRGQCSKQDRRYVRHQDRR
jgi:hypothetical protein